MNIPRTARYTYCVYKSHEFLLEINKEARFPINIEAYILKQKWGLLKYSELAAKKSLTVEDIKESFSEDGYSIYNKRNYAIAYNDTIASKDRIYFTQMHEIGHIVLGHFMDFEQTILQRSELSLNEYKVLENEANCFTRNVEAPAAVVQAMNLVDPAQLNSFFGLSYDAANVRLSFLESDLRRLTKKQKQIQLAFFHDFIYKKACSQCGHSFVSEDATFCPICGHAGLSKGDGDMLYGKGFLLDENGRAMVCPSCGNEEMDPETEYCRICGTYLINRCSNIKGIQTADGWLPACGKIAHGNSRYCEHCGSPTTFGKQKFLMHWSQERQIHLIKMAATYSYTKEKTKISI